MLTEMLRLPDSYSDSDSEVPRESDDEDEDEEEDDADDWRLLPLDELDRRLHGKRKTIVMSTPRFEVLFKKWKVSRRIADTKFKIKNDGFRDRGRELLEMLVIEAAETAARMAVDLGGAPNAKHLRLATDCLIGKYNPYRKRIKAGRFNFGPSQK